MRMHNERALIVPLAASLAVTALSVPAAAGQQETERECRAVDSYRTQHPRRGQGQPHVPRNIQVGPRPYYLIDAMDDGSLKRTLQACEENPLHTTEFSIGHRGAALQFPEHTKESYNAGARMGSEDNSASRVTVRHCA